jgi:hypothetical protein
MYVCMCMGLIHETAARTGVRRAETSVCVFIVERLDDGGIGCGSG